MDSTVYLDRLLARYSGTFDIYKPYNIHGEGYPAYGYFFSCIEKYVLTREANLWTSKSYEHVLFLKESQCTGDIVAKAEALIKNYMEPELVRKGGKVPDANHMYSFLTVSVICDHKPDKAAIKRIKKFRFEKGYRFNIRGYSQGHLAVVSMDDESIYTNYTGRKSHKLYQDVFSDVKEGKIGLDALLAQQGETVFIQESSS